MFWKRSLRIGRVYLAIVLNDSFASYRKSTIAFTNETGVGLGRFLTLRIRSLWLSCDILED